MTEQRPSRFTPAVVGALAASVVSFGVAVAVVAAWLGPAAATILVVVGVVMAVLLWTAGASLGAVRRRAADAERARIERERR